MGRPHSSLWQVGRQAEIARLGSRALSSSPKISPSFDTESGADFATVAIMINMLFNSTVYSYVVPPYLKCLAGDSQRGSESLRV
jgi:hypothetical protein